MTVLRIVPNLHFETPQKAGIFYQEILGLEVVMDQGWIVTFASGGVAARPQINVLSQNGDDVAVPDVSIEVDDVDAVFRRAQRAGHEIVLELRDEPWGVRRFFVRDPAGRLLNILQHKPDAV